MYWILLLLSIGLVLLTLPGLVESGLLSIAALFAGKQRFEGGDGSLKLGILVPAHDEEGLVAHAVSSLLAASEGETVTVIAHNCTDQTAARATEAGARVWPLNGPAGKGYALEDGFRRLLQEGMDAVLVVDADGVVDSGLVRAVKTALQSGADAVQCRYELQAVEANPRELLRALAFRTFNHIRALGREGLGVSAGIYGSGFALSRRALEAVPYEAHSGVEDLEYHLELTLKGLSVRYLQEGTVWSELPTSATGNRTQQARWDDGRRAVAAKYFARMPGAISQGRWSAVEAWMNAASLPLSLQLVALGVLAGLAALLGNMAGWAFGEYFVAGITAITLSLILAAQGYSSAHLWKAAGFVPKFVIMKVLRLSQAVFQRRNKNEWVRTERAPENPHQFPKEK